MLLGKAYHLAHFLSREKEMTCMPAKEFKDAFPLSWQRFIEECKKDGISFEQVKNAEKVYFSNDGETYKVSLRKEEKV